MYCLAHFSDPHLGPLPVPSIRQLVSKRVLGYINWSRHRAKTFSDIFLKAIITDLKANTPDHIALTGDLVNIALPEEFAQARRWLDALGAPENISLVPGNHDAYVPSAFAKAFVAWAPYMRGDDTKTPNAPDFPYLRRRGPLTLIGCSTAQASAPFMATGVFTTAQAQKTAALLRQTKESFRVILLHHPPLPHATAFHKRLIGARRFCQMVSEVGAELILHGHTHVPSLGYIPGPSGQIPVMGVAAASNGPGLKKPAANYNLFFVAREADTWRIRLERRGILDHSGQVGPIDEPLWL